LQELESKIDELSQLIKIVKTLPQDVANFAQELEVQVKEAFPTQAYLDINTNVKNQLVKEIRCELLHEFRDETHA